MSNQFNLETIEVNSLPELQGWREKQEAIVKENPFILITDNKSFEEARKARTNLVTARTTIEKQDKLIASKLKEVRAKVGEVTNELILITLSHENKQQDEVKRYESVKEAEKEAKEKAEKIRKEAIENKIESFFQASKLVIENMTFENIELFKRDFQENLDKTDVSQFEEFELQFASKVQLLNQQITDKVQVLTEKENQRIEAEKFAKEKAEFEAEKKAKAEADEKERLEREAQQKEIDKANAKKEAELNAMQKAIDEAETKKKAEARAKAQAEEKQRLEAEEKERAEAEAKRKEALKPTIEKLNEWVDSFQISICPINEKSEVISVINKEFQAFKQFAKNKISNIK